MGGDATWVEATTSKSDFRSTCYASASSTLLGESCFPLRLPVSRPCAFPSRIILPRTLYLAVSLTRYTR